MYYTLPRKPCNSIPNVRQGWRIKDRQKLSKSLCFLKTVFAIQILQEVRFVLISFTNQAHEPPQAVARTSGMLLYFTLPRKPCPLGSDLCACFFVSLFNYPYQPSTSTRLGRRGCLLRRLCLPELPCFLCSACLQLPFLQCRPGAPDA